LFDTAGRISSRRVITICILQNKTAFDEVSKYKTHTFSNSFGDLSFCLTQEKLQAEKRKCPIFPELHIHVCYITFVFCAVQNETDGLVPRNIFDSPSQ
jgi:hypothetical protein